MAEAGSGLAKAGIGAAALVVGAAGGFLAGKSAAWTPPPPPVAFVNPLADARRGESLALRRPDGSITNFRVLEEDPQTVLLLEESQGRDTPLATRQLRVSRSWFGGFLLLEGDSDPELAAASLRDLTLERVERDPQFVEALGRTVPCWKFTCRHRVHERLTTWVSEEVPVHGVVRIDTTKTERTFVLHGFHEAR